MSEERDYHLKKKDWIPLAGIFNYHSFGNRALIDEGLSSKNFWYHLPREMGLVIYNTLILGSALVLGGLAEKGLENLVK